MRKIFYTILVILNLLSIIFMSMILKNLLNEIILFPLLIIIAFEFILIIKRKNILNLSPSKLELLMSLFLCILFIIMLPLNYCLNKFSMFSNINLVNKLITIIFVLSLCFSLIGIFLLCFLYNKQSTSNLEHTRKKIMVIIFIISLLFVGSTSTGLYDWDFKYIWACGEEWGNWHTLGFTFLVYFCKVVFNNPYLIIIMNFFLYIYFNHYALKILERVTKNKNILVLFLCINLFALVGFDQLRYILKDVLFALSFCILIATVIDYFTLGKYNKQIISNFIVFSIIMVLFRHGTLYLLVFIFLIMTLYEIIKKQYFNIIYITISVFSFVSSYLIVNYIGFNILNADHYPMNFTYTVPIYQIGAFANDGYQFTDSEKEYLEKYLPIDYLASHFRKYNADTITRAWFIEPYIENQYTFDYRGMLGINLKLFLYDPKFYVNSLLDLGNILWKIEVDDRDYWPIEYTEYLYKYDWSVDTDLQEGTIMYRETPIAKICDFIINTFLKSFLFNMRIRGALPLFMFVLSALLLINKKFYKLLLPIVFILFWYGCLILSMPASITRYVLPFINIYPFIFCLALGIQKH